MPTMSSKELEEAVADGKIKLISLDTNVLRRYNYGLEYGLLNRLEQFAASDVDFVLSDIVIGEMTAHMLENVKSADQALKKAVRDAGGARDIEKGDREALIEDLLGKEDAKDCVARRISEFVKKTRCTTVVSEDHVKVGRVVSDYFDQKAPFEEKESKKNEFPDAFALQALEAFAVSKGTMAVVVSSDGGWRDFCDKSDVLVCETELASAMSRFQKLPSVVAAQFALRVQAGNIEHLVNEIERELIYFVDGMTLYVEASAPFYYEPELEERRFVEFQFAQPPHFNLVDQDEDEERFDFQSTLDVTIEADCGFSFSVRDEGDQIPIGGAYTAATNTLRFEIAFSVYGNPEGEFDAEGVEVLDHEMYFDFGHVEPDYDEPDYDH